MSYSSSTSSSQPQPQPLQQQLQTQLEPKKEQSTPKQKLRTELVFKYQNKDNYYYHQNEQKHEDSTPRMSLGDDKPCDIEIILFGPSTRLTSTSKTKGLLKSASDSRLNNRINDSSRQKKKLSATTTATTSDDEIPRIFDRLEQRFQQSSGTTGNDNEDNLYIDFMDFF